MVGGRYTVLDSRRPVELGALGAYLAALLWIGIRSSRRVKSWVDYTLAGRDIPWAIVLATTAVTMVGGGASVGMVSRVYQFGVAPALVTCGWHVQLILTGLWIAPKLRRLNLVTVGDYFELKFGKLARALAVVNCVIFLVGALTAQMAAMGTIASHVLGIPYGYALLVGATVTVYYSTVGGMRAVVTTDVMQFVILVGGTGVASAILMGDSGGFAAMAEIVPSGHFDITGHWSAARVVSLFAAFFLGEFLVPPYAARCFIAQDAPQARWGVAGGGLFLLLFLPIATVVLGLSAAFDPEVSQAAQHGVQQVYPALLRSTFHPALAGVMLAALVSAAMSSADSCLSSQATVIMEDLYRRYINPAAKANVLLRVAQVSTLLSGIGAAVCAYFFSDIAEVLEFAYDFWAPTMVVPFLVGLFWYKETRVYAVFVSMVAGMLTTVVWRFGIGPVWELGPALVGFVVAALVFLIALPFTNRQPRSALFQPIEPSSHTDSEPQ